MKNTLQHKWMAIAALAITGLFAACTRPALCKENQLPGVVSVTDVSGVTNPGSMVEMTEPVTGKVLSTTADGSGRYTFSKVKFYAGETHIIVTSTDPDGNAVSAEGLIRVEARNFLTIEANPDPSVRPGETRREPQTGVPAASQVPCPDSAPAADCECNCAETASCEPCVCMPGSHPVAPAQKSPVTASVRAGVFMPSGELLGEANLALGIEATYKTHSDFNLRLGFEHTEAGVTDGSRLIISRIPLMLLSRPRKNEAFKNFYAGLGIVHNITHYSDGHFPDVNKMGPAVVVGMAVNENLRAELLYNYMKKYGRNYGGYMLSVSYDNF